MTASLDTIISKVKRLISLPADDTLFTTNDYLDFINDLLIEKVYPRIMKVRDNYFLVRDVFNLQNAQSQDLYPTGVMPIPNRAWGNTLVEIKYIDVSGNYYKVNPYYLSDLDLYVTKNLSFSSAYQKGYIPFNSGIKLVPPPIQDNGSIEMHYILSPSILIPNSAAGDGYGAVENMVFNSTTNVTTYTTSLLTANGYMDLICAENSTALFDIYEAATGMLLANSQAFMRLPDTSNNSYFTGTSIVQNGTDILSPNITELTNFQFGGYPVVSPYISNTYIVPAGICPFTTVPPPIDNLLVYEMAIKILSAQGYVEELQIFMQEHADLRKDIISQMAMRVDDEPHVISNKRGLRPNVMYGATSRYRNR